MSDLFSSYKNRGIQKQEKSDLRKAIGLVRSRDKELHPIDTLKEVRSFLALTFGKNQAYSLGTLIYVENRHLTGIPE